MYFKLLPQNLTFYFVYQINATTEEQTNNDNLMNTLAWFFFKLLVFGYVEDLETGVAFRLPGGLSWRIFVEVLYTFCSA